LRNSEDAYSDPGALPVLEWIDQNRDHIENIDSHLLKTLGMAQTPLAYVVRAAKTIIPSIQDPSAHNPTIQEEMVTRMPHMHISF
jgi:hypothetical protein